MPIAASSLLLLLAGCMDVGIYANADREDEADGGCGDEVDNDDDGLLDCEDLDCAGEPECPCDDSDGDGVCNEDDQCYGSPDSDDADGDGNPDACDPCPEDDPDDSDGDGVCNSDDVCEGSHDGVDLNQNGIPDGCETGSFALSFDGIDDMVEVPWDASLDTPGTGLTVEAWIYYDRLDVCGTTVQKGTSSSSAKEYWLHKALSPQTTSVWSSQGAWTANATSSATAGVWTHYAGVYDPVNSEARVYVDGAEVLVTSASAPTHLTEPLRIGHAWGSSCPFDGMIDEVRISSVPRYDGAFTPLTAFAPDADTLALWHFDEGSGSTVVDSSGNGNNGTITGAAWTSSVP